MAILGKFGFDIFLFLCHTHRPSSQRQLLWSLIEFCFFRIELMILPLMQLFHYTLYYVFAVPQKVHQTFCAVTIRQEITGHSKFSRDINSCWSSWAWL
jgi:hypothetical protein